MRCTHKWICSHRRVTGDWRTLAVGRRFLVTQIQGPGDMLYQKTPYKIAKFTFPNKTNKQHYFLHLYERNPTSSDLPVSNFQFLEISSGQIRVVASKSASFTLRGQDLVFKFARTRPCFNRSLEFFTSSILDSNLRRAFNTMTGVCVDGSHSSLSLVSDGESHMQPTSLASHDQKSSSSVQSTPDIEKKYVHRVYDAIAPHFSSTRFARWPKVATFLNSLPQGFLVLDAGCGNGKYLGLNPGCFYIGCDISPPLINICLDRGHEVMVADAVNLPYRTGFGDAAISIAVLHHLSTESRRRKAIEELVRVVRKGGLALITVWAVEQEDSSLLTKWTPLTEKYADEWVGPGSPRVRSSPSPFALQSIPETEEKGGSRLKYDSKEHHEENVRATTCVTSERQGDSLASGNGSQQEYFVPWHLPYHRAEVSGISAAAIASGFAQKDDKKGTVVYNRYYHCFIEGELERLASGIENAVIRDRFYDKSNWCIILEKT